MEHGTIKVIDKLYCSKLRLTENVKLNYGLLPVGGTSAQSYKVHALFTVAC